MDQLLGFKIDHKISVFMINYDHFEVKVSTDNVLLYTKSSSSFHCLKRKTNHSLAFLPAFIVLICRLHGNRKIVVRSNVQEWMKQKISTMLNYLYGRGIARQKRRVHNYKTKQAQ